jgi:hypothetical protein
LHAAGTCYEGKTTNSGDCKRRGGRPRRFAWGPFAGSGGALKVAIKP